MNSEERRALLGDELYERIVSEAQQWAADAPPFTEEQSNRLRALLRPAPVSVRSADDNDAMASAAA